MVKCSDGTKTIACPPPGSPLAQEGSYPELAPSYMDNGDGTVIDLRTGLHWELSPPDAPSQWAAANTACNALNAKSLGGYASGWRLPLPIELISISNYGTNPVAPDMALTPLPNFGSTFWTSAPYVGAGGGYWVEDMNGGFNDIAAPTASYVYRCVHGTLGGGAAIDQGMSFFDPRTGLEWQKDVLDQRPWLTALQECEASVIEAKTDWRLPTIKELSTLVDVTHVMPAADPLLFPGLAPPTLVLFSSTPDATDPTRVWTIDYTDGRTVLDSPTILYGRRCVRGPG